VAAPGRAHEVITAFVGGADAGLRVIGISVLVLGGLVVLQSLLSRRMPAEIASPHSCR
jgi:uncharacterized protein YjeT (DUF2065 family)